MTIGHEVVVVGGGGSGLATAIEARALGRDLLLLEKNPQLGGSTAWSIGSVTASGTPHQARAGIADTAESHWRDMAGFNGVLDARDNATLRRVLADEMPETFRWLMKHGVARPHAECVAAAVRDELRHHRFGAVARPVHRRRNPNQQTASPRAFSDR